MKRDMSIRGNEIQPMPSPAWAGLWFASAARFLRLSLVQAFIASAFLLMTPAAHAVDGCKVMLCIAGNWQNIATCRPEVEAAMREVERGRGWPQCSEAPNMGLEWTTQATCPPFYAQYGSDSGAYVGCSYGAIVRTTINGAAWADMFWAVGTTSTSTRYYPPARAALAGNIDPRYDTDAAQYVPPPPVQCVGDNC